MMEGLIIGAFGLNVALITFARRYKNYDDQYAGCGIAGWGLFGLFVLAMTMLYGMYPSLQ